MLHQSKIRLVLVVFITIALGVACKDEAIVEPEFILLPNCGEESALAECLSPQFSPEYYIDQGVKYFLTMESSVPIDVRPNYSNRVVRWEWPPWLLLTGYTRAGLVWSDIALKLNPTAYDLIDCRFFEEQPFCRCHVIFNYGGEPCPIYEEFVFNDQGEITFIEAWSDFESLLPMGPGEDGIWDDDEYWGKTIGDNRLATRVPGLGNATGNIDLYADWMKEAMKYDEDLNDLILRARTPIPTWIAQLLTHQEELAGGCEAPEGDIYPYYEP